MDIWKTNFVTSLVLGALVFTLMAVPGLIHQYRRYGSWDLRRMIGLVMVCVYMTALVVYTMVPLPEDGAAWCATHHVGYNMTPFAWVSDLQTSMAQGAPNAVVATVALQVIFNVVLFIPFGMLLRRYFSRGFLATMLIGLATTLLIETAQFTGLFGFYPCAIRVADIDDVIMNFLGCLLGYALARVVLFWLPRDEELRALVGVPRPVTVLRRGLGLLIDGAIFYALSMVILISYRLYMRAMTGQLPDPADAWGTWIAPTIALFGGIVIPALLNQGTSPGKATVWLHSVNVGYVNKEALDEAAAQALPLNPLQVIMRGALLPLMWYYSTGGAETGLAALVFSLIVTAHVISIAFTHHKRGLMGVATGTTLVDVRESAKVRADRAEARAQQTPPQA